ncbi:5'-nucleotidase C-terminal domain-containing protein [Aeromicrobium wangtongii]|uniref:5'-nucleotidase C-terminal domain-containing protein n=1 Tax=Aeromicrobium wangtongii TaxID=2969247 RepID=UPI00201766B2|nr:5'-nucleotidase C-terminal domain-containing protein [Aeromicrobium wangtongii]MCL3819866.1 5'-nucleotidase C-terminal domain-containing protein [Aeromicrobium wangtongii]
MSSLFRRLTVVATATLLGAPMLAVTSAHAADDVTINLIGINDFHGRIDSSTVQWAGTVDTLRAQAPGNSLLISAGDNVSASLFASAVQDDTPTIDVLNALGLDASAAGNHEFDKGYDDLVNRIIPKAKFPILGANVRKADGSRALDAYKMFDIDGVRVAVIGAVTQETPSLVRPAGITGLTFGDPAAGINEAVTELDALPEAQRPDVMVASFHEGAPDGSQTYAQAAASSAVFKHLAEDTSPEVDAIFMGHTHQKYAYDAPVPGSPGKTRPILQTGNYGENVGQIKLEVNPDTGEVTTYTKQNVARLTTADAALITQFPELAAIKTIRDDAVAYAAKVGNVNKGTITGDLSRAFVDPTQPKASRVEDRGAESTMGNVVGDALLATVKAEPAGADLALVNPGGLREELYYAGVAGDPVNTDGVTTYAELNSILPFANNLNSVKVSGATLKKIFEQQWQTNADGTVPSRAYLQLGMSRNVSYTYDDTQPAGSRITSIRVNGTEVDPAAQYKIATFSFLATGGDNFRAFKEGVVTDTGLVDRDGWITYFENHSPISPDYAKHGVKVTGAKSSYRAGDQVSVNLSKLDMTSLNSPANTTVKASVKVGDRTIDVGSFAVTAGAATVAFPLPDGVAGDVTLTATAAPSGTTVMIPMTVAKYASTTTATAPAKAKTGTTFTVEAKVASESEALTPTGTVSVKEGDTVLGSAALTDGKASVTVNASKLSADEHALTVSYSGDGVHAASTASAGTIDIVKGGSGFGAVAAPGTYGTSTTVKVSADPEASGLVYVTEGGRAIGLGFLRAGTGTVTLDGTALAPGTHSLAVYFGGDEKFDPTSTTASLTIAKAPTKLKKVSVSPSRIVVKRTKAFVTLSVKATGFTVDGGKVTLRQSGKNYSGTVKNGKVRIRLAKFTSKGSAKKITATYGGNKLAEGSSTTFTVKVRSK